LSVSSFPSTVTLDHTAFVFLCCVVVVDVSVVVIVFTDDSVAVNDHGVWLIAAYFYHSSHDCQGTGSSFVVHSRFLRCFC
jgi:hypothetical protein